MGGSSQHIFFWGGEREINFLCRPRQAILRRKVPLGTILLVLLGSLIIAMLVALILRGQMKSVRKSVASNAFLTGELKLMWNSDVFTHRTETRRMIERNSSSDNSRAESGGGAGRSGKF